MSQIKKNKFRKNSNLKDLDKLSKTENSCIHLYKIEDHLALHPYHLGDINGSLKEILNQRLGKFCARSDGILCGYKNVKLLSQVGTTCEDSCFIHVDIEADFFIFKPTPQKILHGFINKKSKDHVGCLVHKIFNVSLPKPKHEKNWIGNSLSLHSEVELQITHTNFDGKLPYIRGAILSDLKEPSEEILGSNLEEDLNVDENIVIARPKKPKKAKKTSQSPSNTEVAVVSKKRKRDEEYIDVSSSALNVDVDEENNLPSSKRTKH